MTDLLIIGFDGADPALLRQWAEEGYLPHLSDLMDSGVSGELRTTAIPITPSAWTSFMTGKNPGKHGIFDFTRINARHRLDVVNFDDNDEPTLFELMDNHTVGTLNVPATYPPRDLDNGFMVSGMMTPSIDRATHDDEIKAMLEDLDYQIEVGNTFQGDNEDELLPEMEQVMDRRTDAATHLLRERDPDVFMVVFATGDRASHWFWKHMDDDHPDHQPGDEEYSDVIRRFYMKTDEKIGELISQVSDDTDIVVMSDHGFTGLEKSINLNNWLIEEGYLQLRDRPLTRARYELFKRGLTMENVYSIVQRLNLASIVKDVADSPDKSWIRELLSKPFLGFEDIDWDETDAYSAIHFGPIFLNATGEHREELKHEIAQKLERLEDDGEPVIDEIEFKEDVFSGNNLHRAPDIIYRTRDMKYQSHRYFEFGSNRLFSKTHNTESGHHRMEGVFIASGPSFTQAEINGAEILDITPTLLHVSGYPVPDDIDGRVMHSILAEQEQEVITSNDSELSV
ncbi:MAG: alkaline phosphatase family protein [Candidatus Nanohaloarchaea archaeon]|nr:alkaline phosphatase family protein [Candidatus Nanohaloarchaea archaeon]